MAGVSGKAPAAKSPRAGLNGPDPVGEPTPSPGGRRRGRAWLVAVIALVVALATAAVLIWQPWSGPDLVTRDFAHSKERLWVTVFAGDPAAGLPPDEEAAMKADVAKAKAENPRMRVFVVDPRRTVAELKDLRRLTSDENGAHSAHLRSRAEVGRVLRPGGRFLFFLNHPLLQTPGSGWIDDQVLDPPEQYWRIGPYLIEDATIEEVEKDVFIPFIHRPLSRYVNALAANGLLVERMVEPAPPPGFLARAAEYQDASEIPRLLWALGLIPLPVSDHWSFVLVE